MKIPARTSERIIAGAMSGTSADGIDVALTEISGQGLDMRCRLLLHHHRPYPAALREEIFSFRGGGASADLARLAQLGREISLNYASAVNEALDKASLRASDISGIAAHGQTLYHEPPNTIQWFDPTVVAAEVNCLVISDFRRADLAAGGQGAPLVPFADYILFRHPEKNRVLLNIGGIANLTWLPAGAQYDQLIAFDTGPGNCVMDYLCRRQFPTGPGYDKNGEMARAGKASHDALTEMLARPFFRSPPPKSTDGPAMIEMFEATKGLRNLPLIDRMATALLFCTSSIQLAVTAIVPGNAGELIVSGGGAQNPVVMHHLRAGFKGDVKTTDDLGIPGDAKEAVAFALLGAATLDGFPSNVPSVTGAKRPVVLGSITPKP